MAQEKKKDALKAPGEEHENFLLRRLGPLPAYGWGLVAVGATGVIFGLTKLLGHKKGRR